ncbi:MAG: carbonic anhydrase [Phycisphaerae bacterium]|nr:carbonic anhydrase [Phycisphaerae bacterium]
MLQMRTVAVTTILALASTPTPAGQPGQGVAAPGPTPDQAWLMLREGNARFASGNVVNPNTDAARRQEVAEGQHPFAIILTCADSRVPAERLFDRGIGDLFVIRVAGNVSDTDEIGTIEYGAGHLNAPLAVVMGHSACGAVKAVASGAEVHGSIPGLVDNIIPAVEWVKKNRPGLAGEELINAAIEANVWQSIDDLFTRSEEVRGLVEANKLKVVGAVYDLASGKVRWLGEHPYQDRLLVAPTEMDKPHTANVPEPEAPAAKPTTPAPAKQAQKPESPTATPSAPAHATPSHKTADAPTPSGDPHR